MSMNKIPFIGKNMFHYFDDSNPKKMHGEPEKIEGSS